MLFLQQHDGQHEPHNARHRTEPAFQIEPLQTRDDSAEDAARHPHGNVRSQKQDDRPQFGDADDAAVIKARSQPGDDSGDRQDQAAHPEINRADHIHDSIDLRDVVFLVMMRDEAADRFAKPKIHQPRVTRDGADKQPQPVLLIASRVQHERHEEQPDEKTDHVVSPTGQQVDLEAEFHAEVDSVVMRP